ncbi:MAG: aminopeptidase N [Polyangiales bacterium]
MATDDLERVFRRDYIPPAFQIDAVELTFLLDPDESIVRATLHVERNSAADRDAPLELHGDELNLRSVALDGRRLDPSEFTATPDRLTVPRAPEGRFTLETEVAIRPRDNTKLMGLYTSGGALCTQCEAEGFRRITYYLDRPDVMARFRTRIEADRAAFPVLLSNGNRTQRGELPHGRHWVEWEDPFAKPSYLFALVAGNLVCHAGTTTTASGREVALEIWVEPQNADKCEHALRSLQAAMRWDEETFGLEYDLDVYMIVAVDDFNMGAMENKGLNVFNSKYVLAKPSTATDDDYEGIEGVVAHEYFHNWTGNRVTCRDWFQLTLKEGLTVYRDQEFSADMTSRPVQRIKDVTRLRAAQFAEDAGPLAHPIRPESYIEMNNFYTATVYEKGAEVVRLYETLLGKEGFGKGLRHYLEVNDGRAVTCDDFRQAMGEANGIVFDQLERWYSQAGTPTVRARGLFEASSRSYALTLGQSQRAFEGQPAPLPLPIPVRVGLLRADGTEIAGTDRVLELRESEETFVFEGIDEPPVASIGRGFSAPVKLEVERTHEELAFLMAHDTDPFNRWEAGQELGQRVMLELVPHRLDEGTVALDQRLVEAFRLVLQDGGLDGSMKALTVTLPSEERIAQALDVVDPEAVHGARTFVVRGLASALRPEWEEIYSRHSRGSDAVEKQEIDRRRMKNRALRYLASLETAETIALAEAQFRDATGMTEYEAAFMALIDTVSTAADRAVSEFHHRWKHEPLVLDKWFRMQATSTAANALDRVVSLSTHPDFTLSNPNRARSLIYAFAFGNPLHFHRSDGAGYRFVADHVLALDAINPQTAARTVASFNQWQRYGPGRQAQMRQELQRIASHAGISKDVAEIAGQALGEAR